MRRLAFLLVFLLSDEVMAFQSSIFLSAPSSRRIRWKATDNKNIQDMEPSDSSTTKSLLSRRDAIGSALIVGAAATVSGLTAGTSSASAGVFDMFIDQENSPYQPAKRPLAYRVDSTIPPTLLGVRSPKDVLSKLGQGSGTDKNAIVIDTINLNNMLNKIIFGSVDAVLSWARSDQSPKLPSVVCFGMPMVPKEKDIQLAMSLLTPIVEPRTIKNPNPTALALAWAPYNTQQALDDYKNDKITLTELADSLVASGGVSRETIELYTPLLQYAKPRLDFLALAPTVQDLKDLSSGGLQAINPDSRSQYVVDPNGFIQTTTDKAFQLYTERSLFKQQEDDSNSDSTTTTTMSKDKFFAKKILLHEAAATKVAQYMVTRPLSLVVVIAPMADVRYQLGLNGRIPRIYNSLQPTNQSALMTTDRVTTILLNPNANDTLSKTKRLRLEINTAPETLDYQQKIADYLWFSDMPRVNLIPRLMEEQY